MSKGNTGATGPKDSTVQQVTAYEFGGQLYASLHLAAVARATKELEDLMPPLRDVAGRYGSEFNHAEAYAVMKVIKAFMEHPIKVSNIMSHVIVTKKDWP